MTGFIAEHNIPLAVADHLGPLFKDIFPDSKIAKNYACGKTKSTCILNQAIKPDLQSSLLEHIKNNYFSISTDGSNDQGLSKMNPVTVRLFDINQHKVVTQFLDMCLSTSSTADGIFTSIDNVFVQNELSWNNCISLGVDNTSVNIGKHHSLITKAREKNSDIILMGCPCHMAHNTAQHAVKMFEGCLKDFNIEELLVDIYYHFDYSSKRKNLLSEFCDFCDQKYHKILKFHSIRWLGLCTCIERTLKLYTSLSSYFRSQNLEMQEGEKAVSCLNRLIDAFSSPLT